MKPNSQTMYYKCISVVNKIFTLMFYPSDSLVAHVCLTDFNMPNLVIKILCITFTIIHGKIKFDI